MRTYSFCGFVAREATLAVAAAELPMARLEKLRLGLSFLPLTDELAAAMARESGAEPVSVEVEHLSGAAAEWGREASTRGPVAYVEGEMEAGSGWHAAVAWRDGGLVLGPLRLEDRSPVNRALQLLGVEPAPGGDEVAALGLDDREAG